MDRRPARFSLAGCRERATEDSRAAGRPGDAPDELRAGRLDLVAACWWPNCGTRRTARPIAATSKQRGGRALRPWPRRREAYPRTGEGCVRGLILVSPKGNAGEFRNQYAYVRARTREARVKAASEVTCPAHLNRRHSWQWSRLISRVSRARLLF
jgi:hypothetical protein